MGFNAKTDGFYCCLWYTGAHADEFIDVYASAYRAVLLHLHAPTPGNTHVITSTQSTVVFWVYSMSRFCSEQVPEDAQLHGHGEYLLHWRTDIISRGFLPHVFLTFLPHFCVAFLSITFASLLRRFSARHFCSDCLGVFNR